MNETSHFICSPELSPIPPVITSDDNKHLQSTTMLAPADQVNAILIQSLSTDVDVGLVPLLMQSENSQISLVDPDEFVCSSSTIYASENAIILPLRAMSPDIDAKPTLLTVAHALEQIAAHDASTNHPDADMTYIDKYANSAHDNANKQTLFQKEDCITITATEDKCSTHNTTNFSKQTNAILDKNGDNPQVYGTSHHEVEMEPTISRITTSSKGSKGSKSKSSSRSSIKSPICCCCDVDSPPSIEAKLPTEPVQPDMITNLNAHEVKANLSPSNALYPPLLSQNSVAESPSESSGNKSVIQSVSQYGPKGTETNDDLPNTSSAASRLKPEEGGIQEPPPSQVAVHSANLHKAAINVDQTFELNVQRERADPDETVVTLDYKVEAIYDLTTGEVETLVAVSSYSPFKNDESGVNQEKTALSSVNQQLNTSTMRNSKNVDKKLTNEFRGFASPTNPILLTNCNSYNTPSSPPFYHPFSSTPHVMSTFESKMAGDTDTLINMNNYLEAAATDTGVVQTMIDSCVDKFYNQSISKALNEKQSNKEKDEILMLPSSNGLIACSTIFANYSPECAMESITYSKEIINQSIAFNQYQVNSITPLTYGHYSASSSNKKNTNFIYS